MVILDKTFQQLVPKSLRKSVASYMRREGWIRCEDYWKSSSTFLFKGNGTMYLKNVMKHCNDDFDGVIKDYDANAESFEDYLKRRY